MLRSPLTEHHVAATRIEKRRIKCSRGATRLSGHRGTRDGDIAAGRRVVLVLLIVVVMHTRTLVAIESGRCIRLLGDHATTGHLSLVNVSHTCIWFRNFHS